MEYGAQIWHGGLTKEQSKDIEGIQSHAMKIICPGKSYEQALAECGLHTLENRRYTMCVNLIKDIKQPTNPQTQRFAATYSRSGTGETHET